MRRSKADRHPHHAGHRHAGIAVGEKAKRSGPAPAQSEFSAAEEKAMRAGAASNAAPAMPSDDSGMGGVGGAPMNPAQTPADLDNDDDGM